MIDPAPEGTLAREYLPDISSLSIDHQATFRIGQMMRLTVHLEQTLRSVLDLLRLDDDSLPRAKTEFQQLADQVTKALARSSIGHIAETASVALELVKATYRRRNRFAHDLFLFDGESRWTQIHMEDQVKLASTVDLGLSEMRDAVLDLVSAQWRVDALHNVTYGALRKTLSAKSWQQSYIDDSWFAILEGKFELTPGGGVRVTAEI